MKLITSITVQQADHDEVIDNAADQIGRAANQAFLFFIRKEIQGWKNLTLLCSWGLSRLSDKHGPIFNEVKGSAIAVFRKGCQQETEFVQELIKTQLTDRLDARWKIHDQAIAWFNAQTQAFLSDNPDEDISDVEAEDQALNISAGLEEITTVAEAEVSFEPDPLDDELDTQEDLTPVLAIAEGKNRSTRKKAEPSISRLLRQEDAKYSKP